MPSTTPPNPILTEFRAHFNEPVIAWGEQVCRVIGYGEDESDCYLIVQRIGGEIVWNTAVGGYYWLDTLKKQRIVHANNGEIWSDFIRLDSILELNGAPKQKEFRVELYTGQK